MWLIQRAAGTSSLPGSLRELRCAVGRMAFWSR